MRDDLSSVVEAAASLLGHEIGPGDSFSTDTQLKNLAILSQRELVRRLRESGVTEMRFRSDAMTAVPANTSDLTSVLPSGVLKPDALWSKRAGALDSEYFLMRQARGSIVEIISGLSSTEWDWRGSATGPRLVIRPASQAQDFRIDYFGTLADQTMPADALYLRDSVDVLATMAAAKAARLMKGKEGLFASLSADAERAIEQLLQIDLHHRQGSPQRRPALFRRRFGGFGPTPLVNANE